jgi:DNA-binding CsgD family transcriptional regulator
VRGYFDSAIDHMDRAVRAADASVGAGAHGLLPHMFRGLALANAGRMDEALVSVRTGRALADRLGHVWAAPFYHYVEMQVYWTEGRLDDLLAECDAALRGARDHSAWLAAPYGLAAAAAVHIFRGRPDEADALLDQGEAMLSHGLQYGVEWIVFIRALWHEANGDRAMALAVLTGTWLLVSGMEADAVLSLFGPDLVRLAVLEGDRGLAQRVLDNMAEGEGDRYAADVTLQRSRGLVAGDVALIERTRTIHEDRGHALELALDDEAIAVVLADRGDRTALAAQLERCASTCEQVGAPYLLERVRQSVGVTAEPDTRRTRARPTSGWDALTATEQLVARSVAAGRRNREVGQELGISVRTVESHVSRILTKLAARNRTELSLAVPPE